MMISPTKNQNITAKTRRREEKQKGKLENADCVSVKLCSS